MGSVSYIITLYNKAPFIPWMIKGLASQVGDFDKQFVFVDDGSMDGSLDLVKKLTEGWENTVYIEQKNQGPSIATNRGAEEAAHTWMKMVDGDDILIPYAGKLMKEIAEKFEADAVYSWPFGVPSRVEYTEDMTFEPEPTDEAAIQARYLENTLYEVVRHGWSGSSNAFFNTQSFREAGGCDERVFVQDWALPLRLAQREKIIFIQPLVCVGPLVAEDRMMDNFPQMIHDLSATHLGFLKDNPNLPRKIKWLMYERAVGRAWKWAHRKNGHGLVSPYFWRYVLAKLRFPVNEVKMIEQSLEAFRERHEVRLPKPRSRA